MFSSSLGNAGTWFFLKKRNFFKIILVKTTPEDQFHPKKIFSFPKKMRIPESCNGY
jgi:hypothetical protein